MDKVNDLEIHCDYLAFTFPLKVKDDETLIDAFNKVKDELAMYLYMDSSSYGEINAWGFDKYDYSLSLGEHVKICFGGKATSMKECYYQEDDEGNSFIEKSDEMFESCMVELKGQGCRELEFNATGGATDGVSLSFTDIYIDIMEWYTIKLGGKTTRFDVAIDDLKGDIISIDKVIELVEKMHLTSCFRFNLNPPEVYKGIGYDDLKNGKSLYLGKSKAGKKNAFELCIYNKLAERRFHDDIIDLNYYVRYELRYRYEKAQALTYFLLKNDFKNFGEFVCGELNKAICLKHPFKNGKYTDDSNLARWDIYPAWKEFINNIKGIKFTLKPMLEKSIERIVSWRSHSLIKQQIILELAEAYNTDNEYIDLDVAQKVHEIKDMISWFDNHDLSAQDIEKINNYKLRHKKIGVGSDRLVYGEVDYGDGLILKEKTINDITREFIDGLREKLKYYERFKNPF